MTDILDARKCIGETRIGHMLCNSFGQKSHVVYNIKYFTIIYINYEKDNCVHIASLVSLGRRRRGSLRQMSVNASLWPGRGVGFVCGCNGELKPWNYSVRDDIRMITVGKSISKDILYHIVNELEPDVVYTTDVVMEQVARVCYQRNIPVITCWHFWQPGIRLGT